MRLLLPLLAACTSPSVSEDTASPVLVFAPPAQTPEVGEISTYGILLPGGLPDRVEWYVDGSLMEFGAPTGEDRSDVALEAPSESFLIEVEAFYGLEPVSASLSMMATPNTAPVLAITSPTQGTASVSEVISLVAEVTDRTAPPLDCTWEVGGSPIAEREAIDGMFTAGWSAVAGSWTLRVACTDKLGATGEAETTLEVQ